MENPTLMATILSPISLLQPQIDLLYAFLNWIFFKLLLLQSNSQSLLHCSSSSSSSSSMAAAADDHEQIGGIGISREEMEIVLERMSISSTRFVDGDLISGDEISGVFEEDPPAMEEVEEAFRVFDEDGDGFIDAGELQRVLPRIGYGEGVDAAACRRMVGAYDEDGDGRIDFREFVRFMEASFDNGGGGTETMIA